MTFKKTMLLAVLLLGTKMSMSMNETQIMRRQDAVLAARTLQYFQGFAAGFITNLSGRHPLIQNTAGLVAVGLGHRLETRWLANLSERFNQIPNPTEDDRQKKDTAQIALMESTNRWALARYGVSFAAGAGAAWVTRTVCAALYHWLTRPKVSEPESAQQ